MRERTLRPCHFCFSETVGGHDTHVRRAQFDCQIMQFLANTLADFFAAEDDAPEILATHALLGRLVEQMIYERRHTDQYVGPQFSKLPQVPLCSHDLPSARTERENAPSRSRIVRQPKGQVRSERKHIEHLVLGPPAADLRQAFAGNREIVEIMLREEKGRGLCASSGGEGDKDRPKLRFEALLHKVAAMQESASDRAGSMSQDLFIRRKNEVTELLGLLGGREQIELRRKGNPLEIIKRPERVRCQPLLFKHFSVIRRKGQDSSAQVMAQFFRLKPANDRFR